MDDDKKTTTIRISAQAWAQIRIAAIRAGMTTADYIKAGHEALEAAGQAGRAKPHE